MTPEEIAARTRQEQEAGRNALRRFESNLTMQEQDMVDFVFVPAKKVAHLPIDPEVKLPADVRASIARGETKFQEFERKYKKRRRQRITHSDAKASAPSIYIMSVVDQPVQDRRDAALSALEKQSKGKRGQPPMLVRLRVGCIIVDQLLAEEVRFATARASQMNKRVRERLNELAARSRKSHVKRIGPDAVDYVLKQIKGLVD